MQCMVPQPLTHRDEALRVHEAKSCKHTVIRCGNKGLSRSAWLGCERCNCCTRGACCLRSHNRRYRNKHDVYALADQHPRFFLEVRQHLHKALQDSG